MPVTLRKRLQCHYCGKRLTLGRRQQSKITCESCTADNFFDEHGNIVDVPLEEASQTSIIGSDQREITSQSDVFCTTCLKNQHMYITALSDYLPDPDDPKYAEIEAALPTFKKQLDLRFPQCCAQCEPRVQERLIQANYAAKSDHLRRVLQRRHARNNGSRLGWRSLVVTGGGLGYLVGVSIQLVWHGLASQVDRFGPADPIHWKQCLSTHPVPPQCADKLSRIVPLSLLTSLLCIWWNPKWHYRLRKQEGRLIGLETYYKMQAFILLLRFAVWAAAEDVPVLKPFRSELHSVSLVAIVIMTLWSLFGIVAVDKSPVVNWQQDTAPLLDRDQFVPPTNPNQQVSSQQSLQRPAAFPLGRLTSASQPLSDPWRPPTPPADEDSMDWTPSQSSFQPKRRNLTQEPTQPSPFYGKLPALPGRGQSVEDAGLRHRSGAQGIRPGFFGSRKNLIDKSSALDENNQSLPMPGPRFFPEASRFETGLENIFGMTFSLSKSQDEIWNTRKSKPRTDIFGNRLDTSDSSQSGHIQNISQANSEEYVPWGIRSFLNALMIALLGFLAVNLCVIDHLYSSVSVAPSSILPYLSFIPICHFGDELLLRKNLGLVGAVWLFLLMLFTGFANQVMPTSGSQLVPMWNKVVVAIVCLLLVQELFYLCCTDHFGVSDAAQAQMAESISKAEQMEPSHHPNVLSSQQSSAASTLVPYSGSSSQLSHWDPNITGPQRRGSDESLSSVSSIKTTTTASGWQTPPVDHRRQGWQPSSATSSRFGGNDVSTSRMSALSLGNDFGTGASIAGPRTRQNRTTAFTNYR